MGMREKLIEVLEGLFVDYGASAIFFTKGEAEVIADHLIANVVTIPVLCKDCKYWCAYFDSCDKTDNTMHEDDFCSYGERRTDV